MEERKENYHAENKLARLIMRWFAYARVTRYLKYSNNEKVGNAHFSFNTLQN